MPPIQAPDAAETPHSGIGDEASSDRPGPAVLEEGTSELWAQVCSDLPLSKLAVTSLWLADHTEQTCFTQPCLWWALLPGIWGICRKSGTVCGIPQPSQLASCR